MQKTALARDRARTKMLLIMRLTVLFLIVGLGAVQAKGVSQNVTLSARNISMEKVFEAIKKQTGYVTFGTEGLLIKARPVSIQARNMPLTDFLKLAFTNQTLDFEITGKTIVVSEKPAKPAFDSLNEKDNSLFVEFYPVKGRITDNKGAPMAGATITIKNKNYSAVTDNNGEFTIEAQTGDLLQVSFVGFETISYKITSRNAAVNLSLKVKEAEESELVITTGYQKISRERATGSYDVISSNTLSKRPSSNISSSLQGLVAGLQGRDQANDRARFTIRGIGTLSGNGEVLVVVDGFPIAGSDFGNINPNDVESVTVLKDAAAASIWGARSANGVIVITTKQGRNLNTNKKVSIEANVFSRIYNMTDLNQVMPQATSADHIRYERLAFARELFPSALYTRVFADIGKPLTLASEFIMANRFGAISAGQMNKSLDSLSTINNRPQFEDLLMRRGLLSQANITLSGATERSKTYASVLYENSKNGFKYSGYDRVLLNFNNQFQPASFLTFNLGANLQYRKTSLSGASVTEMQQLSPYETLLNPDGSYSANINTWNREQQALLPLDKFPYSDWSYNLLREVKGRERTSEDIDARLQASMNIQITKSLNLDTKLQYERNTSEERNYFNEETFEVRNRVNNMVEYNNTTRLITRQFIPKGGILKAGNGKSEGYVFRSQLSYNKAFNQKHQVNAIAGTEISRTVLNSNENPWLYGYQPETNQSAAPPYGYGSSVDQLKNFNGATATVEGGNPLPSWRLDKYVSFYANASYTYNDKYTLTASARSDASNYITDDPSLRWSPFWSVGGMWHIYREKFMNRAYFIDRLSVRLTHGRNGNTDRTTSTKPLLLIGTSPSAVTGTIIGTVADNGNPLLRWEKTITTNLGFDFSFFKNKLTGKIDLYDKKGEDIMGLVQLPAATGTTAQRFNNAAISNRGIEVQLGSQLVAGNNFRYNPIITYAYNKNEVTQLYFPNLSVQNLVSGNFQVKGRPIGTIYAFKYLGMTDSVPYFAGVKGAPTSFNTSSVLTQPGNDVLLYKGTTTPPHTLGFVNNIGYGQFNLMVIVLGKFGGVYRSPIYSNRFQGVGNIKTNVSQTVREVFAGNPVFPDFPKYRETGLNQWDTYLPYLDGLVESSSFIDLKEINLEYLMPSFIVRKAHLSSAKIFVQARDLGMLWSANKMDYHPEWLPGSTRPVTSYTIGLNVKF